MNRRLFAPVSFFFLTALFLAWRGSITDIWAYYREPDAAELAMAGIIRSVEERQYWGSAVASMNPTLTSWERNEIGRAVMRYSAQYGLKPSLVVAVIIVESGGRLYATSPKGAQGLMQVMPFWKEELGIEGNLFEIDTNIGAGCRILSGYIRRWGYREGITRYYAGSNPVGDGYLSRVEKAMQMIAG